MSVAAKKGVILLVVVFVGFYLFTDPNGFAVVAKQGGGAVWSGLTKLFAAIISFLNAMFA